MNKLLYRTTGRYFFGSDEKSAQYVFQFREDAPKDLKRSFLIDIEKDGSFTGSALSVAHELKYIIDSYLMNTDKRHIQALIDYLEKWEEVDDYDYLIARKAELTTEIESVVTMLEDYDHEEMEEKRKELMQHGQSQCEATREAQ